MNMDLPLVTLKYIWEWWNDHDSGVRPWTRMVAGGTRTNDNASSGQIGEYVSSSDSSLTVPAPTSGNAGDLVNIPLTSGDWDVSAVIYYDKATLVTDCRIGISSNSGNSFTGLNIGDNYISFLPCTSTAGSGMSIPSFRVSLSSSKTYYLKMISNYSGTAPNVAGRISARRVR